jgi:ethanolamine utilization protein EutQ
MGKPIITAAEVNQASGTLIVARDAIVTPLARDIARDRGVEIVREGQAPPAAAPSGGDPLADQVRALVPAMLGSGGGELTAPTTTRHPVKLARIDESRLDPFPYPGPPPGMQVATGDVVTDADGAPMAAGYMTITQGSFPWTLNYDEVQIVLEGELHLGGDAGGKVGRPGDILYVPKGSHITFGTPTWAKFVYVTFPANWEDA